MAAGRSVVPLWPLNAELVLMKLVTSLTIRGTYDLNVSVVRLTFTNCAS